MTFRPPLIERRAPTRFVPAATQGRALGADKQFGASGQFKSYDWPTPKPFPYPKENRTWIQATDLFLIGKDIQFGAPGQFKTYDWPLPRTREQGKTWTYSLNQTTLAPTLQVPFFQTDWPIRIAPRFIQAPTQGRVVGPDTFFGPPGLAPVYDWPLPRAEPYYRNSEFISNTLLTVLGIQQPQPFNITDWPLSSKVNYPQNLRTFLASLNVNLIGQDQFFGAQGQGPIYDWPTPRTAVRLQDYTWLNNLSQSTLSPFIEPMPFNLYDWPLTRSTVPLVDLHSLIQSSGFPDQIPSPLVVEIIVPPVGGGASGAKRYRQPAWWGDEKKRKLLRKVEAVQLQIEKKREQIDLAPDLFRIQRLIEQIAELQKRMMKLLEQIDELNKIAGEEEALLIYTIYRSLH